VSLFKKDESGEIEGGVVGGCSSCDMRGPTRPTFAAASKDASDHADRMHDGRFTGGYVGTPPKKGR
jgi:hypothetical protein